MSPEQAYAKILTVASRQLDLVTKAQLHRLGVNQTELDELTSRKGPLRKLDWDVFRLADTVIDFSHYYAYASWLALRPASYAWERPGANGDLTADAVISHESAADVFRLGSLAVSSITFTAPTHPLPESRTFRVVVTKLNSEDVMTHEGLPVTTPHRTIVDLIQGRLTTDKEMRSVMFAAVRQDLIDLMKLYEYLRPMSGEYCIPSTGRGFIEWYLPNIDIEQIPERNAQAIIELTRQQSQE